MRRLPHRLAAVFALALAGYLAIAPVPAEPVSWQPAPDPGYTGPYARNTRLADLRRIALGEAAGPEHIALGPDGLVYAALEGGAVLRMRPDGGGQEVWARSGGRVLGFEFDAEGRMIAADALRGLIAIDAAPPHAVRVLADRLPDGSPIVFPDAVTIAPNGDVYFTDATRRFSPASAGGTFEASLLDLVEHVPTGHLMRGQDGRIWLGLPKPRTRQVDAMAGRPFLRKIALRLPRVLWPVPPDYGHVIAFLEDGRIVADLQDPSGGYAQTTGVLETADRLYIQSLNANAIGWLPRSAAGL